MLEKTEGWMMPRAMPLMLLLILFTAPFHADFAHARAGYAKWVKHGDIYKVDGRFGSIQHTFKVEVTWKGSGFVINTPLGAYRLKRSGSSVKFNIYFHKAWAQVTWKRTRAVVIYKGQRGSASVVKLGNKAVQKKPAKRKQNFNLKK
jgi:hypothetical protein